MVSKKNILKLFVSFALILVGLIIIFLVIFIRNYNIDKKNTMEFIKTVDNDYKIFIENCNEFNKAIEEFYDKNEELYTSEIKNTYNINIDILDNISNKMINVFDESDYLEKNCVKKKYINDDIKAKCNTYKITYNNLMDIYNDIIDDYNEILKNYNDENEEKLELYNKMKFE